MLSLCLITRIHPLGVHLMYYMHIILRMLTDYLLVWEYHGRNPRTSPSAHVPHILDSSGIWIDGRWHCLLRRRQNTSRPLRFGRHPRLMYSKRSRSSMGSYCTHAWFSLPDEHVSQAWKPCWDTPVTILSYHGMQPWELPKTLNDGQKGSVLQDSAEPYLHPKELLTVEPSPMPAQKLELLSSLGSGGERGVSVTNEHYYFVLDTIFTYMCSTHSFHLLDTCFTPAVQHSNYGHA